MLGARWPDSDGPTLVLEPGVGLVADAMHFVSTVVAVKEPHGRRVAVLTGGRQNIKPTDNPIRLPVVVWGPEGRRDSTGHRVTWAGRSVHELAGQDLRLEFFLEMHGASSETAQKIDFYLSQLNSYIHHFGQTVDMVDAFAEDLAQESETPG